MKARDLMIGDWVQVPCLIDNTENYNAWCQIKQLRDGDLDVIGFKELSYDEIEPIPITPEILEKNGFKYMTDLWYTQTKEMKPIQIVFKETNVITLSINCTPVPINLKYVHQLQHALRLYGIKKDILL
jgi:hypothetical protein